MGTFESRKDADVGLRLCGLNGTNPLGFLAALGSLQVLTASHNRAAISLSWENQDCEWTPAIHGVVGSAESIASDVANQLRCPFKPDPDAVGERDQAQKVFEQKNAQLRKTINGLKKRRLRGKERAAAEANELGPLRSELANVRSEWLNALRKCVPSMEIALGKHLNASCDELREAMERELDSASQNQRAVLDLYSAFGSDACSQKKSNLMQPTPFCFTTGSGHQYFLETVRELMTKLTDSRFAEALFCAVEPADEKLSMRWDPREDRRYAVMWSDPTASGNESKTNWAANLLAYQGLQLLPSIPTARGLRTTGWCREEVPTWNWPIWRGRMTCDGIRSLLSHPYLVTKDIERDRTLALGVVAVYQSVRIQVGNPPLHKVNFTPARQIA
jgi:hypothetical protein